MACLPNLYEFTELRRTTLSILAPHALLLLPTGAVEQHGPHLPVGTDLFAVSAVTRRAAERVADLVAERAQANGRAQNDFQAALHTCGMDLPIVIAPALPFGNSDHHLPFGGTISLSTETYYHVLTDVLRSLVVDGFRRIFIINGHGGNHEVVQLAARDMALRHEASIAAASYWQPGWDGLLAAGALQRGDLPGHAGAFETSVMLALRPELVAMERPQRPAAPAADGAARPATTAADAPAGAATTGRPFTPAVRVERHGSWQRMDGFTDSPAAGEAAHGEAYLDAVTTALARAMLDFYQESEETPE